MIIEEIGVLYNSIRLFYGSSGRRGRGFESRHLERDFQGFLRDGSPCFFVCSDNCSNHLRRFLSSQELIIDFW